MRRRSSSRWSSDAARRALLAAAALGWGLAAACLPGTGPALLPDDAGGGSVSLGADDGGFFRTDAALGDPFAIDGLSPSHGPFNGGTRSRIDGRGFSSRLRVFVGAQEIPPASLLASDPTRAAIILPSGGPGFVDVTIRDEATESERVLKNGFYYDAFYLLPDSGATSGGTRIAITGSGTAWGGGTTVAIGGAPCTDLVVLSPTSLECMSPPGTPGAKDVVVTSAGGEPIQARDAFTYSDSTDGYRGGLSGGALSGRVKVLAFDALTATPLPDAFAIAGDDIATAKIARTSAGGVVEIGGIVGNKVTVTVAAKCHSPLTFVDVPVETVTAYLDPVFDPSCLEGEPGNLPGGGRYGGVIEGQLVFPGGGEFGNGNWTTVPVPTKPTERRAAYAFVASPSATRTFELPDAKSAITPGADGTTNFGYSILVYPGNATVYVIAGIEDRSTAAKTFVPYAMGVARGIPVPVQSRVTGVDIRMDVLFDHRVTMIAEPPPPGPRGPDRFTGQVAVTLGSAGYAILPRGERTLPLPTPGEIPFVGVPALDKALTGEQYVLGGIASTGPQAQLPASVVTRVQTTNANTPVSLGGFLGVPVLAEPANGVWGGTHVEFSGASGPVDLSITDVSSGMGLVRWRIVAPAGKTSFHVPDLAMLPGPDPVGLIRGEITTTVSVARIEGFDYARLRSGQLASGPWSAFAYDRLKGAY